MIVGTTGAAELAHYYFARDSDLRVVGFTVDSDYLRESSFKDLPVVPFEEVTTQFPPERYSMFVAIGYAKVNRLRAEKYFAGKKLGYQFASYISSRCTYLTEHPAGENCFILEDNTIQPFVEIGNNVTIWSSNNIGHNTVIRDHCFVTSQVGVAGLVEVGEYSFLGVGSCVRDGIRIGKRNIIGMGTVITRHTEDDSVYVAPKSVKLGIPSAAVAMIGGLGGSARPKDD